MVGKQPSSKCRPVKNSSLSAVVVVGRIHRTDHGEIIDTLAHVRPPVAHVDAALTPFFEPDLRGIDLDLGLVDDVVGDLLAHVL